MDYKSAFFCTQEDELINFKHIYNMCMVHEKYDSHTYTLYIYTSIECVI